MGWSAATGTGVTVEFLLRRGNDVLVGGGYGGASDVAPSRAMVMLAKGSVDEELLVVLLVSVSALEWEESGIADEQGGPV